MVIGNFRKKLLYFDGLRCVEVNFQLGTQKKMGLNGDSAPKDIGYQ
jgi:hypothetical protein